MKTSRELAAARTSGPHLPWTVRHAQRLADARAAMDAARDEKARREAALAAEEAARRQARCEVEARLEREAAKLRADRLARMTVALPCVRCGRHLGDGPVTRLDWIVGAAPPLAHGDCQAA